MKPAPALSPDVTDPQGYFDHQPRLLKATEKLLRLPVADLKCIDALTDLPHPPKSFFIQLFYFRSLAGSYKRFMSEKKSFRLSYETFICRRGNLPC